MRGIGAGATLFGMSGVGSATTESGIDLDTKETLVRRHEADSLSDVAVAGHLQDELDFLAEKGFVEETALDQLSVDDRVDDSDVLSPDEDREGFAITATAVDGEPTALLSVKFSTNEHDVTLYAQPERDDSYAVVTDGSGDRTMLRSQTASVSDSCSTQSHCQDGCPNDMDDEYITVQCCPYMGCGIIDSSCSCFSISSE